MKNASAATKIKIVNITITSSFVLALKLLGDALTVVVTEEVLMLIVVAVEDIMTLVVEAARGLVFQSKAPSDGTFSPEPIPK